MKIKHNLNELDWILAGCIPHQWQLTSFTNIHEIPALETSPIPVKVPGSVQKTLLEAGLLPDWNQGLNAPLCEWVENRHWLFQARLPSEWLEVGLNFRLHFIPFL